MIDIHSTKAVPLHAEAAELGFYILLEHDAGPREDLAVGEQDLIFTQTNIASIQYSILTRALVP